MRAVKAGRQGHKKRQDRFHEHTKGSRVKQKLGKKQNDVRGDIGETRVVIEMVVTSLAAEQVNECLNSRSKSK